MSILTELPEIFKVGGDVLAAIPTIEKSVEPAADGSPSLLDRIEASISSGQPLTLSDADAAALSADFNVIRKIYTDVKGVIGGATAQPPAPPADPAQPQS